MKFTKDNWDQLVLKKDNKIAHMSVGADEKGEILYFFNLSDLEEALIEQESFRDLDSALAYAQSQFSPCAKKCQCPHKNCLDKKG